MDERANKIYDKDPDCNPNCFLAHQISARIVYEIVPRMNYSVSKIQVMGSQYRSLGYSGGDWWLLGRLCNVSDRPGIFSKRLGDLGFFSGGPSCDRSGAYCV